MERSTHANAVASVTHEDNVPLRTTMNKRVTLEIGQESARKSASHSPTPSQAISSNFQMTQNLNQHNLQKETLNSPLRHKSRDSEPQPYRSTSIAVGGQDLQDEYS